jgi:hypothetical protein
MTCQPWGAPEPAHLIGLWSDPGSQYITPCLMIRPAEPDMHLHLARCSRTRGFRHFFVGLDSTSFALAALLSGRLPFVYIYFNLGTVILIANHALLNGASRSTIIYCPIQTSWSVTGIIIIRKTSFHYHGPSLPIKNRNTAILSTSVCAPARCNIAQKDIISNSRFRQKKKHKQHPTPALPNQTMHTPGVPSRPRTATHSRRACTSLPSPSTHHWTLGHVPEGLKLKADTH